MFFCLSFGLSEVLSIIQIIFAILACILAVLIPKKIAWEQLYSSLLIEYFSYDFGAAIIGVLRFFYKDCNNDIEKIEEKYCKQVEELFKENSSISKTSNDQNLYYQRRLLTQFYYQLDLCARTFFVGKKRIQRDFSSKEANLLKVLFFMNDATMSPKIYMDISTDDRLPKNPKGINSYIQHIYTVLKDAPDHIR